MSVQDLCRMLTEHFLNNSWTSVKALVERVSVNPPNNGRSKVTFFRFSDSRRETKAFDREHFFLRGSVEYANPHLTIEEIQGIIGVRLLETVANYFFAFGLHKPEERDVAEICDRLKKGIESLSPPRYKITINGIINGYFIKLFITFYNY